MSRPTADSDQGMLVSLLASGWSMSLQVCSCFFPQYVQGLPILKFPASPVFVVLLGHGRSTLGDGLRSGRGEGCLSTRGEGLLARSLDLTGLSRRLDVFSYSSSRDLARV